MIILVTTTERNKRTGVMETIVSHGVDHDTLHNVCLSCDPLSYYKSIGAVYLPSICEWVLMDKDEADVFVPKVDTREPVIKTIYK